MEENAELLALVAKMEKDAITQASAAADEKGLRPVPPPPKPEPEERQEDPHEGIEHPYLHVKACMTPRDLTMFTEHPRLFRCTSFKDAAGRDVRVLWWYP